MPIYVPIKGDYTELEKNIKAAKQMVSVQAVGISDALNNALSPAKIRGSINGLVTQFGTLDRASKISKETFSKVGAELGELGKITGLTKEQLKGFQSRLLETKAAKAQENALRRLKSELGLTSKEVTELGNKFGLSAASIKKVTGEVSKQQSALSSIKSHWLGYTAAITAGYIAVRRVAGAIDGFIEKASEQAAVERRLAAVQKATGNSSGFTTEELIKQAAALQQVTKVGDEAIIAGQAILATFKEVGGDAFQRATVAALDMSEVMQQDLKSSITQVGKALNDPIKGLTALSRVGVSFTESQKNQIKTLQESGNIYKAQAIILQELESEFGGAAKAARDADGGLQALKNTIGDFQEKVGFALTKSEGFKKAISGLEKTFTDPDFIDGVTKIATAFVDATSSVVDFFAEISKPRRNFDENQILGKGYAEAGFFKIEDFKNAQLTDRFKMVDQAIASQAKSVETLSKTYNENFDVMSDWNVEFKKGLDEIGKAPPKYNQFEKHLDSTTKRLKEHADRFLQSLDFLKDINKVYLSGNIGSSTISFEKTDFGGLVTAFKEATGPSSEFQKYAESLGINTGDVISKGIENSTGGMFETFKNALENIQRDIAKSIKKILDGEIKDIGDLGNEAADILKSTISEGLASGVSESVTDYIGEAIKGIKSGEQGIIGTFKDIFSTVSTVITSILSTNPYLLIIAGVAGGLYALGESSGSEAKDTWKYATGTGTVLGDRTLESESLSHGIDLLKDVNTDQYGELQAIRSEMVQLNKNLSGVTSGLIRTIGNFSAESFGIEVGKWQEGVFDNIGKVGLNEIFGGGLTSLLSNLFQQIGGSLGNLINWVGGGGKKRELLTSGIQTGGVSISDLIAGAQVDTQAFARVKTTKSGLFGSKSSFIRDEYKDVDETIQNLFTQIFENMGETLVGLAKGFGSDNLQEVLSYAFDVSNIDLKDLSGEEISAKLSAWISEQGDTAVDALFGTIINQYQRLDEGLLETATRLISDKESVFSALEKTNQSFIGTNQEAIAFSETLIAMSGDLNTLSTSAGTYYESFFTNGEKFKDLASNLSGSLGNLGQALPDSRNAFRDMVEGIDLTTDSGKQLYVTLLQLSGSAAEYYTNLESIEKSRNQLLIEEYNLQGNTAAATELTRKMRLDELNAIDATLGPIQERIWALQDEKTASEEAAKAAAKYGDILEDRIKINNLQRQISGLSPDDIRMAAIADRYSWTGTPALNTDNTINKDVVRNALDAFAKMAPEAASDFLMKTAEDFGVSIDTVISDMGYLSDALNVAAKASYELTVADRESFDTLQKNILGMSDKNIKLSQISSRWDFAGAGLIKDNGTYDWNKISSNLNILATQWTPEKLLSSAESMGISFDEAAGDVTYLNDTIRDMTNASQEYIDTIDSAIQGIKYSNLNVSVPGAKYIEAGKDYETLLKAAKSGNVADVKDFTSFASTYLQSAQDTYKSSGIYQNIYNQVMTDLASIKDIPRPEDNMQALTYLPSIDSTLFMVDSGMQSQIDLLTEQNEILKAMLSQQVNVNITSDGSGLERFIQVTADKVDSVRSSRPTPPGVRLYS